MTDETIRAPARSVSQHLRDCDQLDSGGPTPSGWTEDQAEAYRKARRATTDQTTRDLQVAYYLRSGREDQMKDATMVGSSAMPLLRVVGTRAGFELIDRRVGLGFTRGVASVHVRDPKFDPAACDLGIIEIEEAWRRARLFAGAEVLVHASRALLAEIDRLERGAIWRQPEIEPAASILRLVLEQAQPGAEPIIQRNATGV